ncbi:polysaccharide biosynthesis tyrosine autokinase [Paraburkholderia aromaticivorans]|uniref:polysaccharide biosynthesis tyrosine autokinase n=1 Tax=Paraburkholderia aromaticivorans TaxID=2026199 RepID=UPI001455ED78|nr:polysaccharide biosynthesis tyrosine autokinase [Paraburkholderia aromaticivorans]
MNKKTETENQTPGYGYGGAPVDADEIDIRSLLDTLLQSKRLIASCATTFTLIGALYVAIARPVYDLNIVVQVESSADDVLGGAGGLIGGLSSLFDVKSTDDGEMEILHSRLVVQPVVQSRHLYIDALPRYFPLVGRAIARHNKKLSVPGLFGMGGFAWGAESIEVSIFDTPRAFWADKFTITALDSGRYILSGDDLDGEVQGTVGQKLTVDTVEGPVTLFVSSLMGRPGTRYTLKRFSEQETLKELQENLVITEGGKAQSGILDVDLNSPDPDIAAVVLNEIADNYVRQNANRKAETAEKSLGFLNAQLPQVEAQLNAFEDKLNVYQNKHDVVDLTEQAKSILGQSVSAQASLYDLEQKRQALSTVIMPAHPQLLSLDREIAAAKANMSQFEAQISKLPDAQQNVVRLKRDVTVQTQIYVGLLNSIQQLRLATASKIGNVRIIDHAQVPDKPVKPKAAILLPISLLLGLVVGAAASLARAALYRKLTDPAEIERDTNMAVLATIPWCKEVGKTRGLLSVTKPMDPAVEALRSLATALQFELQAQFSRSGVVSTRGTMSSQKKNIVLVTGPAPGIGKSFVASNVAALLAGSGKRVLLIDGDVRRGYLAREMGVSSAKGLSDVLKGDVTIESAIVCDKSTGVYLLPSGAHVGQPIELFSRGELTAKLVAVSEKYDVVILDAPPILPVTDATVFAKDADIVLMVARADMTTKGEIVESVRRLERVGAPVAGVVFNALRPSIRTVQYGNYGGYTYENAAKNKS